MQLKWMLYQNYTAVLYQNKNALDSMKIVGDNAHIVPDFGAM